ncbi:hypothetical protein BU24DRAFT_156234 [Aaosphaeria arxii CBS 175.79]|uniref:Uncharacterized protein n=1 Tax=Aaosphaeria arxii CBS 175.79 TaxID=1450172 RepID=A0A6A5XZI1_9PLEO|nr:uncharacterized protein BU24DRAFT_156234 [Aaosphaeria arxii CBS 175.79]KAF2017684.1 hypothetical protein BU24DRAFT_156234 [Aaosphaeria arxii CBS 175.79]
MPERLDALCCVVVTLSCRPHRSSSLDVRTGSGTTMACGGLQARNTSDSSELDAKAEDPSCLGAWTLTGTDSVRT